MAIVPPNAPPLIKTKLNLKKNKTYICIYKPCIPTSSYCEWIRGQRMKWRRSRESAVEEKESNVSTRVDGHRGCSQTHGAEVSDRYERNDARRVVYSRHCFLKAYTLGKFTKERIAIGPSMCLLFPRLPRHVSRCLQHQSRLSSIGMIIAVGFTFIMSRRAQSLDP